MTYSIFSDELPKPANLNCLEIPQGLSVSWDRVTDSNSSCARSSLVYGVTVMREVDMMIIISMNNVEITQIEIMDSLLEPSQNYSIRVRTKLVHGTCVTGEATIVCRTSDDLSPTTAPARPTTPG